MVMEIESCIANCKNTTHYRIIQVLVGWTLENSRAMPRLTLAFEEFIEV
jgi:hypothetical protein